MSRETLDDVAFVAVIVLSVAVLIGAVALFVEATRPVGEALGLS